MATLVDRNVGVSPTTAEAAAKREISIFRSVPLGWLSGHAAVRWLCAGLVLASGALKASQMMSDPLAQTTVPLLRATIADMWWWEIGIVVVLLLSGAALIAPLGSRASRTSWRLAGGLYSVFIAASALRILAGEGSSSCGCFGVFELNAWYSASISLAILGGIVLFPPGTPAQRTGPRRRGVFVALVLGYSVALFLALGAAVALSMYDPLPLRADNELVQARAVLLRPSEWVGRRCPLLQHVAIDGQLEQGAWGSAKRMTSATGAIIRRIP